MANPFLEAQQGAIQSANMLQERQQNAQIFPLQQKARQLQIDGQQLDIAMKKNDAVLQLLGASVDQPSWERSLSMAQGMGLDVSKIPRMFDPQVKNQLAQMALTTKDRITQAMQERQQGETERHNLAVEGQYAEGLRGQRTPAELQAFEAYQKMTPEQRSVYDTFRGKQSSGLPASVQEYEYGQRNPGFANYQQQKKQKPMPAAAMKMQAEYIDDLRAAATIKTDMGALRTQLESGKLDLGPIENKWSEARNFAGNSSENSRNYGSFISSLKKMQNDSLRLNKGVQTEGDAVRAWNELFQSINDVELVKQRLMEIEQINERAAQLKNIQIDTLRQNYGNEPMDTGEITNVQPAVGGGSGLNAQEQMRLQELRKKYGR